jgi:hypothetical protein
MMTYSILGWSQGTGDLGVAVRSRFPSAGNLVPYGPAEHRLSHSPSDPSELVPVGPELGSENYDDRINDGVAVDVEVLADLGRTYGRRPVG